jgi:hypothetical protein
VIAIKGRARSGRNKKHRSHLIGMEYQGTTYTVVQGIERRIWKWSVSVAGMVVTGQEETKSAAVAAAEKAIDRALAPKKVRRRFPR